MSKSSEDAYVGATTQELGGCQAYSIDLGIPAVQRPRFVGLPLYRPYGAWKKIGDWGAINMSPLRGLGKQQGTTCPPQPEAQKNTCPVGRDVACNVCTCVGKCNVCRPSRIHGGQGDKGKKEGVWLRHLGYGAKGVFPQSPS